MSHFPRPHKCDLLGPAGRRLVRIPRYARLMAILPTERFARLQSEASTFWEVYTYVADRGDETGLLDDGLKATEAAKLGFHDDEPPDIRSLPIRRWQTRLALDMLAAVAFEMYCGRDGKGTSPPVVDVRASEVDSVQGFLKRALGRLRESGAYVNPFDIAIRDPGGTRIWTDWDRLKAMDSHGLKYFVFSENNEVLRFNDSTTRAFLAAYWASRWANDEDRIKMRGWIPDPLCRANDVYAEFWRFVAEMPSAADPPDKAFDPERWESLLAPCYDGTLVDAKGFVIRSTEMIYRTWQRMKDTPAGCQFRDEFRHLRKSADAPEVARQFEGQFLSLCQGKRGSEDTGHFTMGAAAAESEWQDEEPPHPVRLTDYPYRLAATCVTNQQYELFEPRRRELREFAGDGLNVDDHPVVNVSWFDAWCFAKWLGVLTIKNEGYRIALPTEAQWEYACRCGRSTPFTWNDGRDGDKIEAEYCNFNGKHPWQKPGTTAALTGPYLERTVGVKEFGKNPWGFYQMHGNVWEWCHDWYDPNYYGASPEKNPRGPDQAIYRVLRGGSWSVNGWRCRSAYRHTYTPAFRSGHVGFRLAAVPQSQARQE